MWARPLRSGGLRIRGQRGDPEVRDAIVRFARWLRSVEPYPVRAPVYLSPRMRLKTIDGDLVTASFFASLEPSVEPYIRLATGDYPELLAAHGRDDALSMFLHSLAHELVHYRQWVETGDTSERGVVVRARKIVDRYAMTTDHP